MQTERKCHHGALRETFRGERLPSDELRHDVGEGEGEAAHALPGRSGSQEGGELVLKSLIVEVKEPVAPRGTSLRCVQP